MKQSEKIKKAVEGSAEVGDIEEKPKKKKKDEGELQLTDLPGVGPGSAAKLEAAGIFDLMGLAVLSPPQLADRYTICNRAAPRSDGTQPHEK